MEHSNVNIEQNECKDNTAKIESESIVKKRTVL